MKVRVLYRPDGTVGVIYPVEKSKKPDETEAQWLARTFAKATPPGIPYDDIDHTKLPPSREDRDYWTGEKGKGVKVDTAKALEGKSEKDRRKLIEAEKEAILEAQAVQSLTSKGLI